MSARSGFGSDGFGGGAAVSAESRALARATWSAVAGVYTVTEDFGIVAIDGFDYGSGTESLRVLTTDAAIGRTITAFPDVTWITAMFPHIAQTTRVDDGEFRVDFYNLLGTQVSPDNGAGTVVIQ